jgi:hypothetical protein
MLILNSLLFVVLTLLFIYLMNTSSVEIRHPFDKTLHLVITGRQAFMLLIFTTGLVALSGDLGGIDLLAIRLLMLELLVMVMLFWGTKKILWSWTGFLYLTYLIWIIYAISYSPAPQFGLRVLLKYAYPFLIMLFASTTMDLDEFFVKTSFLVRKVGLIVIFLSFIVPFVLVIFPGVIWYGTALAIHFIFLMILSVAIYDVRRYKRDLIMAVIFFIPCLLWVFRTSILGSVVALMVFSFIKYKLKALPVAFILLALFFSIVFLNPAVKNKMFRKDMDIEKVISSNGTSFDKDAIDSNGRFAMWAMSLKQFYDGKELTGSGSGTLQAAFYKMREKQGKAGIVHNDYVQILCDTGLIGLFLYLSIFVAMGIHATKEYGKRTNSDAIKVCAITAAAAGIGMAATAFTDNTVNYSMATLSYPFGMYGMMLGLIRAQNNKPQEIISEDEDLS